MKKYKAKEGANLNACVCGTLYLGLMEFYFFELLLSPSFYSWVPSKCHQNWFINQHEALVFDGKITTGT